MNSVIKTVTISGEVFFPGIYPVTSNQTLSELINRAGGLTEDAYIKGSTFIRESLRIAEQDRLKKATVSLRKKIALGSTTSAGINENTINAETLDAIASLTEQGDEEDFALGRLVINLEAILNKQSDDIFLEDKDSLVIPKKKQSILVIGEVIVPNSHVFSEAYDINDYINLSGGMTEFADNDNTYIIKANGNIISAASTNTRSGGFFRVGTSQLESGDTIVVPLELTRFDTLTATTEISQIIYQMAIAAAAVNSF